MRPTGAVSGVNYYRQTSYKIKPEIAEIREQTYRRVLQEALPARPINSVEPAKGRIPCRTGYKNMDAVMDAAVEGLQRLEKSPALVARLVRRNWIESVIPTTEC